MNEEQARQSVVRCTDQLLGMLQKHGPEDCYDLNIFLCAFSHVLGVLVARTAAEEGEPVEPLLKLAVGTVQESARGHDAYRRGMMQ